LLPKIVAHRKLTSTKNKSSRLVGQPERQQKIHRSACVSAFLAMNGRVTKTRPRANPSKALQEKLLDAAAEGAGMQSSAMFRKVDGC
jgi:hypothetical protein